MGFRTIKRSVVETEFFFLVAGHSPRFVEGVQNGVCVVFCGVVV